MAREPGRPASLSALNVLAGIAVAVAIAGALYWARAILVPLTLAIYLTFILTPPVVFLQRRGLPQFPAVMLVLAAALIGFATVGLVVGRQVVQLTNTLPDHADEIKAKVAVLKKWTSSNEDSRLGQLFNEVTQIFAEPEPVVPGAKPEKVVVEAKPTWVAYIQAVLSPAAEVLGQAAFTFILLAFIMNRRQDLRNRVLRLLGQGGGLTTTTKAVDEMSRRISRFLFVQFLLNMSFGCVVAVGLLLIKVPYAPLWGFLGFLMRYVPYVGTWIAVIPPTVFTLAVSDGWWSPVLVFVLFITLELLAGSVAEPLLFGHSLGMSEVAQLVSAAVWAFLWGPVGLILSWPMTVCLLVLGKYVPRWGFLTVLLGDEPALSPRATFYQRLTAHDQDEAADILAKELAARPAEAAFEDVVLPALAAAQADVVDGRLAESDLRFMATAVHEILDEVAERKPSGENQVDEPIRLLIAPGKNPIDHAAGEALEHLLDPTLWDVERAPAGVLTSELVELVESMRPAILVVAALPPGGLSHTRYLCKRLRQRFPDLKLVVGRWAAPDDDAPGWAQLKEAGADEVSRTLEGTKAVLTAWRTVLAAARVPVRVTAERAERIGTVSA